MLRLKSKYEYPTMFSWWGILNPIWWYHFVMYHYWGWRIKKEIAKYNKQVSAGVSPES